MPNKIKYASLHQTIFVPNVGHLGATLPPTSKNFKLEMWHGTDGLMLTVDGVSAVVPWANVAIAVYAEPQNVAAVKASAA